jgi:Arylsulfotransferase (ASST)
VPGGPLATRWWVLVVVIAAAVAFAAGLFGPGALGVTISVFAPPPIRSSGVVTNDQAHADGGYVTVGVLNDQRVDLVAQDGRVVHSWQLPNELAGTATMDANGDLTYLGRLQKYVDDPPTDVPNASGMVQRLDWDGNVIWTFEDDLIHHDFTQLPDGTLATLRHTVLPAADAARIPGGIPDTELVGRMFVDQIVEADPTTGDELVVFDIGEAWQPEEHPIPDYMQRREWTHANSIEYTDSDPVSHQEAYLISFRTTSTIMLVARETGRIIWSYGEDWVLNQQHDPTLLPNGHVLVFDNGQYLRGMVSASRALEIDPLTDEVVWTYQGYGIAGSTFYSPITGGAQRLPNGNTLITLGTKGQLVEVTSDGDIVWDYRVAWGPEDPKYPGETLSFLFKSRSYPADEVSKLLGG